MCTTPAPAFFFIFLFCKYKMRVTRVSVVSGVVGLLVAALVYARSCQCRKHREPFFPLLIAAGVGIAKLAGADKKLQEVIGDKVPGAAPFIGGGGGAPAAPAAPAVTYSGRAWDGSDWSCPPGTVETGGEDSKACMNSQFHPPVWKWDGKVWGYNCPAGTVPTFDSVWEKKCEVGWMGRMYIGDKWQCPEGTTDSGNNWGSPGNGGYKQCKRNRAYTQRIPKDGKWVCPEGTTDTGRSWGSKANGGDQCKWAGP